MTTSLQYWRSCTGYQSGRELNSRFCYWRTSVCMELHLLTWGNCWKSMSHHGHWDQHPRTYSASRETTWKPTVTDRLVPVPQNYGISSQIIFGQLGVWQSSNDDWKHICSKMYISINYVDINIYPLTMECNAPLSMFMERAQYQMTILLLLLLFKWFTVYLPCMSVSSGLRTCLSLCWDPLLVVGGV